MRRNTKHISAKTGKIDDEKGFTLLEVIFAISILTIGILAVAVMQGNSIRGNSFAGSVSSGTTWASDKMEKLIAAAYDSYDDSDLSDSDGDGDAGLNDIGFDDDPATQDDADHRETQGNYTVYWNISENSVLSNTKTISLIVIWTDHGVEKNVSMRYVVPKIT